MLPKWHIILGLVFSAILFFVLHMTFLETLLVFLSSFLFDVDHYIVYVKKFNSFSLKKAYFWHKGLPKNHTPVMHIFHTIEFFLLLFVLSFFFKILIFIALGLVFHHIIDLIDMIYSDKLGVREFSFIRYLIRRKYKHKYLN